MDTETFYL